MDDKKYVILTGATSGIGFETAKKLYELGYNLILANRNQEKAKKVKTELEQINSVGSIDLMELDLASFKSIISFANEVKAKYKEINILINNAGVLMRYDKKTVEGFELTEGVNHLGTYLLTEMLLDKLLESKNSKIIMVSSIGCYWGNIKINENTFYRRINTFKNYFDSKLSNLIYTKELTTRFLDKDITILAAEPGIVYSKIFKWKTKFGRSFDKLQRAILKSPEQGAAVVIKLITDDSFYSDDYIFYTLKRGRKLPKNIRNIKVRQAFMKHTETVVSKYL